MEMDHSRYISLGDDASHRLGHFTSVHRTGDWLMNTWTDLRSNIINIVVFLSLPLLFGWCIGVAALWMTV